MRSDCDGVWSVTCEAVMSDCDMCVMCEAVMSDCDCVECVV